MELNVVIKFHRITGSTIITALGECRRYVFMIINIDINI